MKKKKKVKQKNYTLEDLRTLFEDFHPQATFDYHEKGILNTHSVELLYEKFIQESIEENYKRILIITGKGDLVRPKVRLLLSRDKRVEKFSKAGYFQGQDGAFEVYLR